MSGNPGSAAPPAPPPVPPPGPPPGLPPVPPAGPQQNPQVYVKEISINKPPIFTGATNRARKWLADVRAYLMLNQAVYNNDEKRILFALSYMRSTDYNSGLSEAEKWADLWMEQHWNNLGLWADFEQAFKDRFITSDEAGEAIRELNKLKVKNQKYDEYINTFQMLARQAKITEYNALMPYFLQGLPTKLVESAYNSTQLPDTMDKWYDYVRKIGIQWNNMNQLLQGRGITVKSPTVKDPDAMDVDRVQLSKNQRTEYLKEGKCFNCGRKGHISRNCNTERNSNGTWRPRNSNNWNNNQNNQNNQGSSNPRPSGFFKQRQVRQTETEEQPEAPAPQMMEYGLSSKARAAHIATLLGGITEEERNSIFSELNEQGF
ncbi:hypothetical protein PNOK_0743000 [Pyrrhoderma noxium]|uniref:CCHC-type domain-containing protein n=1 Tax=Pyrrhoderma noxium TaxID=2282107 RepID=A0A286UCQ9_9AGAM|nr:hypothetical protein PNOK_0743000 [Pyrrhoderma noxium]